MSEPKIKQKTKEAQTKSAPKKSNLRDSNIQIGDLDFIRSTSAAMLEETPKRSRFILYLIIIMLCSLTYWAAHAPLDEISRGEGKVIPSHQIQIVQNLEGGAGETTNP